MGDEVVIEENDREQVVTYLRANHINGRSATKYAETFHEHGFETKDQVAKLDRGKLRFLGVLEGHTDLLQLARKNRSSPTPPPASLLVITSPTAVVPARKGIIRPSPSPTVAQAAVAEVATAKSELHRMAKLVSDPQALKNKELGKVLLTPAPKTKVRGCDAKTESSKGSIFNGFGERRISNFS
jgi:hypothetical protein